MSNTLSPLAEYILAYGDSKGNKIARFGLGNVRIPIFPRLTTLDYYVSPLFGSYCSILIWHAISPKVVPNVFTGTLVHEGTLVQEGNITELTMQEGHNVWAEITERQSMKTTLTNLSDMNQYFESSAIYLLINNEGDLKKVRELVMEYGNNHNGGHHG